MRKILWGSLFLATTLLAATKEHVLFGVWGGRTLHRGYSLYTYIDTMWMNATEFTVDAEKDVLTAAGHGLANGASVRVWSTDTLPDPLGTYVPNYTAATVTTDTLKLSGKDFKDTGAGVHKIGTRNLDNATKVYVSIGDLPAGVTSEFLYSSDCICPVPTEAATKRRFFYNGTNRLIVRFDAATDAPPGPFTVTLTYSIAGLPDRVITYDVTVAELHPVTLNRPMEFPPIPQKASWENQMVTLASKWCRDKANPGERYAFGVYDQAWFYDGAWVYNQVADYTRNPEWNNCAQNVAAQYWKFENSLKPPGNDIGLRIFTDGVKRFCGTDEECGSLVKSMLETGPYYRTGGEVTDWGIRETAFRLETAITYWRMFGAKPPYIERTADPLFGMFDAIWRMFGAKPPYIERTVDLLLGMFDAIFVSNTYQLHQLFYDGLAMRALIRYYEVRPDPRIPAAIKTALDWIWANAWDPSGKQMYYNPDPRGPRCASGCREWNRDLMMMVAPAFAWYWSITADDTYRQRGDEMFANSPRSLSGSVDPETDVFTVPGHGLSNNDPVTVRESCLALEKACYGARRIPAPLVYNLTYYARNVTPNTFKLSAKPGGFVIDIASAGVGLLNGVIYRAGNRGDADYSGKLFSQTYRWAFEYIHWREGTDLNRP
jgi:hypothetical protein